MPRSRWPVLIILALLLEASFVLLARTPGASGLRLGVWLATASTFYLIACALVLRAAPESSGPRVSWIVLAAVVFRLTLLPLTPQLSHELWRFHWDGEVQTEGFNPYEYAPQNPLFAPVRQPLDAAVPHQDAAAFHPPLAEHLFHWSEAWLGGLRPMKLVFVACDLLLIGLLIKILRKREWPAERVLLYAWSPLAVFEVAGNGHMEPVAGLLVLLALLGLEHRPRWAGVAAISAALTQWYAVVLLPLAIVRAGRRWLSTVVAMVVWAALLTVSYMWMSQHFALGTLATNAWAHARALPVFNASVFAVAAAGLGRVGATVAAAAVVAAVTAMALLHRPAGDPLRAAFLILGALLLVMPQVQPWYVLWLLPLVVFWPEAPWLYFSVAVWLAYALPAHPSWMWLEYVPLYGLLLWQAWPRARRRDQRAAA